MFNLGKNFSMTFTCVVILTAAVVRPSPLMGFPTEKFGLAIPSISLAPATAVQWAPKVWRISRPLSIPLNFYKKVSKSTIHSSHTY